MDTMDRPYVICHMFTSLDGKIDGAFFGAPESGPGAAAYGRLRGVHDCRATLYGTTTMKGSYSDGLAGELPPAQVRYPKEDYKADHDAGSYVVSIDPEGILGWEDGYIEKKGRPRAHVIEVLTEAVSEDYLAYLRERGLSYIFAGKERLDCGLLLRKLKEQFAIDRLMIAGGGIMNWSFLQEGLIDELSLVVAPVADGSATAASIFEQSDFLPGKRPVAFRLLGVEQLEGGTLWLRYAVKR